MPTTTATHDVLFEGQQQFRQVWIWGLLAGVFLLVVGSFTWGVISEPEKVAGGVWILPAAIFLSIYGGVALLLWFMRLTVRVDHHHLHVRFFPLLTKNIPLEEIEQAEARTYRPILEYGGWGLRYGWKGTAYNVSGNRGVQLVLRNGKRILIGSQRAEELAAAIRAARER
jgi:hypothetical protein